MNPVPALLQSDISAISNKSRRFPVNALFAVLAVAVAVALGFPTARSAEDSPAAEGEGAEKPVSYYEQVRPAFQAKCQGCHQPAKARGGYAMTEVAALVAGGEGGAAVVPGKPEESYLMDLIVLHEGEERPEMPPKDEPMTPEEVALVARWIAEGAHDDTPENARQRFTQENPPRYSRAPLVTAIDFSPDGALLAVAGFHEILLHRADGSGLEARLVGLSERVESVRFSPDGARLLAAGGLPGRLGEVQVWDLAKRELELSRIVGFDTAYGASWSPDGTQVAFGLPDNTLRAIRADDGAQTLFMGSHNDWVLDTGWSLDGGHLVSVGRDMTAKLTEVESERFIDNITSITPGVMKGGLNAVTRHPAEDHILVGGADGVPQIYRMHRETARKIGDNANLIRKYPALEGRIWDVAFAPDGKTFAAVSSLDGRGQLGLYRSDYDATISPELKELFETARREAESDNTHPKIEEFHTRGAEILHRADSPTALYALAFSPDGTRLAVAGADGTVRLHDAATLEEIASFPAVEVEAEAEFTGADPAKTDRRSAASHPAAKEALPTGRRVVSLELSPEAARLESERDYRQLLVTAVLDNGDRADLTRLVEWGFHDAEGESEGEGESQALAEIEDGGLLRPLREGEGVLTARYGEAEASLEVAVAFPGSEAAPDFIQDVNPIITRLGCNMGTCHGANDGKGGFKLSLRGYDPLYDIRGFADDHASRRASAASPDDSLMLLKATGAVPHEAGVVTEHGSRYYHLLRDWIAGGAPVDLEVPRVASIELFPKNPVIQREGARQQFRVVARYADGRSRDVTREAFVESGDTEVAEHDDFGLLATLRRGEAPVLARYEGAYAATTLTVMGDREGFTWEAPETWSEIDQLVASKWERMKLAPSGLCSDEEFIRRVHLDLTGLPPTADETRAFVADERPLREKRDALVDALVGSPEFVDHWTNKWSDLLQVNSKFLGTEGAKLFREWIHAAVEENRPYDRFVHEILTASGSNKENPAASYFKILRDPEEIMENTTHLFLATRFNCNKCHDHPFERWTQDQYFETAAWFARVDLARDRENAPEQNIGGSAVEGARPLYEIVSEKDEGELLHERTGAALSPAFPYEVPYEIPARPAAAADAAAVGETAETPAAGERAALAEGDADAEKVPAAEGQGEAAPGDPTRREEFAAWLTSAENPYFALSYANRLWGYLLGTGLIEPLDDIRAGNPPSNPQLLEHLTKRLVDSGFDSRAVIAEICKSRTYQLSIETNEWNEDDALNYSRALPRRLPAETLYDTIHAVVGTSIQIPGAAKGVRASQLPDARLDHQSGFLATLGRPVRESACECERSSEMQMSAVMAFLSGPAVGDAIGAEDNALPGLVANQADDRRLVEELYYRVLARSPNEAETEAALASMAEIEGDHESLLDKVAAAEVAWVKEGSRLEIERLQAIAAAEAAIETYRPEHDRKQAEAEKTRRERLAAGEKAVAERRAELPQLVEEFASGIQASQLWTRWRLLQPESATASDQSEVEILPDGSIRSLGGNRPRNLDFLVTAPTPATAITGILIESVPDERNRAYGPGLNDNGNFVITEVQARWHALSDPEKQHPLAFSDAVTSFNQNGFDVKNAINGNLGRDQRGWALSGGNHNVPQRAAFRFKEPAAGDPDGAALVVGVLCRYTNGDYPIGRFRLWYTVDEDPLQFGLPETVALALAKSPTARGEAESEALRVHVEENDPELREHLAAQHAAERPVPPDPEMVKLAAALAAAETEVELPATLVQIRSDADHSTRQAANRRLTAAQDLVWALINSPSFLFNR